MQDPGPQIEYSNVSAKWRMPARSYWFEEGDVAFYALDLTDLAEGDDNGSTRLTSWLDEAWSESDATWRVVFAHFPYASAGKHGNGSLELRAFLEENVCGRADLYVTGHDHDLQWLEEQPRCKGTELVVSGASADARALRTRKIASHFAVGNVTGFFWFEFGDGRWVGRAYDAEGRLLFERVVVAPE